MIIECDYRYLKLTPEQKNKIVNGAGPSGAWYNFLIPNTLYGLSLTEVFNIHDFDYYSGVTLMDKERADTRLLDNMFSVINHTGGVLSGLRRRRALKYYEAVVIGGEKAFLKGKGCLKQLSI